MSTPAQFTIAVRRQGGAVVVVPSGELDLATVQQLDETLRRQERASLVILDLGQLSFMDSAGLALVVAHHHRAHQDGFEFRVGRGPDAIMRLFAMTGLERRITWTDSDGPAPETSWNTR